MVRRLSPADSQPAHPSAGLAPGASAPEHGGAIPGCDGAPAFSLTSPVPSGVPILIAVPHAGRTYPAGVLERMRHPEYAGLRLEDRLVDRLGEAVARETGAALLVAHAPRAMIDLNRAADDVDWSMFARPGVGSAEARSDGAWSDGGWSNEGHRPSRRARGGLGLIPRRVPGIGELWKRQHERSELAARIADVHEPYHGALSAALERLRSRWGAALLIDLHSMPPLPPRGSVPAPEFVVGDRFGSTCSGALVATAFAWFSRAGRHAAHNRPYAGGHAVERHAAPQRNIHALQLEIDRTSYLDPQLVETGDGLGDMIDLLTGLVRTLAGEVAALGRGPRVPGGWAEAAE